VLYLSQILTTTGIIFLSTMQILICFFMSKGTLFSLSYQLILILFKCALSLHSLTSLPSATTLTPLQLRSRQRLSALCLHQSLRFVRFILAPKGHPLTLASKVICDGTYSRCRSASCSHPSKLLLSPSPHVCDDTYSRCQSASCSHPSKLLSPSPRICHHAHLQPGILEA
jgi:hypothetical protein